MRRYELTDEEWEVIADLFPTSRSRGRPWRDHRAMINAMMPHMHTRGTAVKYTLHYPDGKEELLLDVPRYDFNWQTSYQFKQPKFVPKGTRVSFEGWWDNSADNPSNPDPSVEVTWGEATHEEMLFGFLSYTNPEEDANAKTGFVRGNRTTGN